MYITVCCDYLTLLTLLKPLDPDPNAEDPLIRIRNTAGQFAVLKIGSGSIQIMPLRPSALEVKLMKQENIRTGSFLILF